MMRYYKIVKDGIIPCIGTGEDGTEITKDEYDTIMSVILSRPNDTKIIGYRLKENLDWEPYEKDPARESDGLLKDEFADEDYAEAGKILMGKNSA